MAATSLRDVSTWDFYQVIETPTLPCLQQHTFIARRNLIKTPTLPCLSRYRFVSSSSLLSFSHHHLPPPSSIITHPWYSGELSESNWAMVSHACSFIQYTVLTMYHLASLLPKRLHHHWVFHSCQCHSTGTDSSICYQLYAHLRCVNLLNLLMHATSILILFC